MRVFAIYEGPTLRYIGLHGSEDDCWRIFLGWPSPSEIINAKLRGLTCEPVQVKRDSVKFAPEKLL